MVSLFEDIGMLCKEMGKYDEARAHLLLSKLVRTEQSWRVNDIISDAISDLNEIIGNNDVPSTINDALSICRSEWSKLLGREYDLKNPTYKKRKLRKGLFGKASLGRDDRPFCFIITKDGESFFCLKSDLPPNTMVGDMVNFDAIPSFDKKKKKESWKASNISKASD